MKIPSGFEHFPDGGHQISVIFQITDQFDADFKLQGKQVLHPHLPVQVIRQGFCLGKCCFQRRSLIISSRSRTNPGRLVTAQLIHLFYILLPVDVLLIDFFFFDFTGTFKIFGATGDFRGFRIFFGCRSFTVGETIDVHPFFQNRVFHQSLLDQFLEFRMGQLKQFDRLLQLGRHDELLVQLHLHFHLQRHVTSFLVKVRIQKFMNGFS